MFNLAFEPVVTVIICILLMVGAIKNRPSYLIPWLVLTFVGAVRVQIATIIDFIQPDTTRNPVYQIASPAVVLGVVTASFVLFFYFWFVTFSLYKQQERQRKLQTFV